MNPDDYIKERLENQINWYDKKSITNQKLFKFFRILEIVLSALIPLIVLFSNINTLVIKIIISGIGVLLIIFTGILSLYHFQENWVEYRTTCESLKHHKYKFLTKTIPYNTNDANAFKQLVVNVEGLISKENTMWEEYIQKENKTDKKSKKK